MLQGVRNHNFSKGLYLLLLAVLKIDVIEVAVDEFLCQIQWCVWNITLSFSQQMSVQIEMFGDIQ